MEEQDNASGYWDGISVSGSTPVRHGDAFMLDLHFMDGCMTAVDNGPWGVLSLVWLPSDVAWSSGPVLVDPRPTDGTIQSVVHFQQKANSKSSPLEILGDSVFIRYPGAATYDLHLAVDNACRDYIYVEAQLDGSLASRELSSGPTFHAVDGLSLSGSVTATAGQQLRFFVTCNAGYIRKLRSGQLSITWIPKSTAK